MRVIFFLVRKEFLQIFRDRTTVVQIFLIPVVQLLVLANAATFDVKRTRLLVVDEDRTAVSAGLVHRLEGGGQFRVVRQTPTSVGIEAALADREATAVLHIPRGFEKDLVRERRAPVQLVLNAEEGAAAGIVQTSATAILAAYERELELTLPTAGGPAAARESRLDLRARRWFNPTRNYKHYMVPALMVSLTTIIGVLLTAQNITREKEIGTLEQLNVTPISRGQFIAAKLIPFWLLSLLIFGIGLAIAKGVFDVPMRGSVPLVVLAAMIYLVVVLGIGLWISTVTQTQQQAMFVAFFLIMTFLLMSGLFTPVESMPGWAQRLAEANPVKHFVFIMRAVLVKGAGIETVGWTILGLAAGGASVLALAVRQYRKSAA
ncbi:MAG: ABC transporter permease [Gemmatimonadales bacterium]|nr:ABC transporter permease [Gemmatimonadales bacterium]MBA3554376.1 ABC transporter permease [Gemmatimonadales bacterium]